MAEARVERRLTAIFAGDVAGYSRLMGADEEGTLARLNAHRREFLEPKIADHRGRIVKRTGALLAQSGHAGRDNECPLLGVKRTSVSHSAMSAFDPKRT